MAATLDLLADWRRYERSLLDRVRNREQANLDLHHEYMELQAERDWLRLERDVFLNVIRRQAAKDRADIEERRRARAANEADRGAI